MPDWGKIEKSIQICWVDACDNPARPDKFTCEKHDKHEEKSKKEYEETAYGHMKE